MKSVTVYTRQMCGFCTMVIRLFNAKGIGFQEHDATYDVGLRNEMIERSGRMTFPQIFIGDNHVGGCDDVLALERSGRLDALLAESE